jgi:hypothetical protein
MHVSFEELEMVENPRMSVRKGRDLIFFCDNTVYYLLYVGKSPSIVSIFEVIYDEFVACA